MIKTHPKCSMLTTFPTDNLTIPSFSYSHSLIVKHCVDPGVGLIFPAVPAVRLLQVDLLGSQTAKTWWLGTEIKNKVKEYHLTMKLHKTVSFL